MQNNGRTGNNSKISPRSAKISNDKTANLRDCVRPSHKNDREFTPRCDILEYMFCERRHEIDSTAMEGGNEDFQLCKYGMQQYSGTCYYNSFVNGILLNPTLTYVAYYHMFEYLAGTFIPKLAKNQVRRMQKLADVIDPSKCSLEDNLTFFTMLFSYFCNLTEATKHTSDLDYHKYVLQNLFRQGSQDTNSDRDNEGGHSSIFIVPILAKKLKLGYKMLDIQFLQTEVHMPNAAHEDLLIFRYNDEGYTLKDFLQTSFDEILPVIKKLSKKNSSHVDGKAIYDNIPSNGMSSRWLMNSTYGISKINQIKIYDFLLVVARRTGIAKDIKNANDRKNDSRNSKKDDAINTLIQEMIAAYKRNDEDQQGQTLYKLFYLYGFEKLRETFEYNEFPIDAVESRELPKNITYNGLPYELSYAAMSLDGEHAVVGTICGNTELFSDSNLNFPLKLNWTHHDDLKETVNKLAKVFKQLPDRVITYNHIVYSRKTLGEDAHNNIRKMHDKFIATM